MNCSSPILVERLLLVLPLEVAVVALVEAPSPLDRDPVAVRGVEGEVGRRDGAAQDGGVDDVRQHALLLEELAAPDGLGRALLAEGNIHPAAEEVLGVPFALAVAEQHECVGHALILGKGDVALGCRRSHLTTLQPAHTQAGLRMRTSTWGNSLGTLGSLGRIERQHVSQVEDGCEVGSLVPDDQALPDNREVPGMLPPVSNPPR